MFNFIKNIFSKIFNHILPLQDAMVVVVVKEKDLPVVRDGEQVVVLRQAWRTDLEPCAPTPITKEKGIYGRCIKETNHRAKAKYRVKKMKDLNLHERISRGVLLGL